MKRAWYCRQQWDRVVVCCGSKMKEEWQDVFLGSKVLRIGSVGQCVATVMALLARHRGKEEEDKEEEDTTGCKAGLHDLLVHDGSEAGRRVLLAVALCWLQQCHAMSPLASARVFEEKALPRNHRFSA